MSWAGIRAASIVALAAFSTACATIELPQTARVNVFGEAEPGRDARLSAESASAPIDEQIEILSGRVPAGIDLRRNEIAVLPSYTDRYEVLGTVTVTRGSTGFRNFFWSHAVDQGWAKALCYPQAPLKLLTLGVWGVVSPLNWPCIYRKRPAQEAKDDSLRFAALRRAAGVMGGNLVLVPGGFVLRARTPSPPTATR